MRSSQPYGRPQLAPVPQRQRRRNVAGRLILILLIVGVLLYFLLAGAVGSWIADNIIAPVFDFFGGDSSPDPLTTPVPSDQQSSEPPAAETSPEAADQPAGAQVENTIEFSADELYALQMGAFAEEANAQALAEDVRARGGAGYVLLGDGLYRVMAAVYQTRDEASVVKDQLLTSNNMESSIYAVNSNDVSLKVTADQAQLDALQNAFECLRSLRGEVADVYIGLDKKTMTAEECRQALNGIGSRLREAQSGLDTIPGEEGGNGVVSELKEITGRMANEIEACAGQTYESDLAFSAEIKYTQMDLVDSYAQFVARLSTA